MSRWAIVSLTVGILFGALAVIAVLVGVAFLACAPVGGVVLFLIAGVLMLLAMSSMRSYRHLGGK